MDESHAQQFALPEDFDIEEIEASSVGEAHTTIHMGTVETWRQPKVSEKESVRPYITGIVVLVWAICTTASLIRFIMTGDFVLMGSPTVLLAPLYPILKYYFKSD